MWRVWAIAFASFYIIPAMAQTPLSDSKAKQLVEAEWGKYNDIGIPYGPYQLRRKTEPTRCGQGLIDVHEFKLVQAAEKLGLLRIKANATTGPEALAGQIELLDKGAALDRTKTRAANDRLSNCLLIRRGDNRITRVVRNEHQRIGLKDYRVVFFNYDGNWSSVYRELIRQAYGETVADKRKAMTVFMGDAFTGEWIFATLDEADSDKPFTTKNVTEFLAKAPKD